MQHGIVLTSVKDVDQLDDCVRRGGYNTVKVVTAWGVKDGGWNDQNMRRVLAMTPNVIVRTATGDPSFLDEEGFYFIDPNRTVAEITPWYNRNPNIIIELGNEPNIRPQIQTQIYRWVFNLKETINRVRMTFPLAKIIAPAVMIDKPDAEIYLDLAKDQMKRCDYIGGHLYEHFGWFGTYPASTGQYTTLLRLYLNYFIDTPWYITELGINDPKTPAAEKGKRYAEFVKRADKKIKGVVYYHLETQGEVNKNYQIYPAGDAGFHRELYQL